MFRTLRFGLATLFLGLATGIGSAQTPASLFRLMPPSETGITFANHIYESEQFNGVTYTNAYNGSGVAAGDVNGDGLADLFFSGTQVPNRLYINKGNFAFEDVTYRAGVADSASIGRGVVMADIDGDGDLDIYSCRISNPNKLFINNGDGTFIERGKEYGLAYTGHSTQAAFLDYDLDGDLDMYLALTGAGLGEYYARYGINDKMYRNNGNGTFTEVTKEAGIVDNGYAMNVLATDVNNDGWPDIYVSNDFEDQDKLYLNNKNGTFTNTRGQSILHTSHSSMGCDAADFNNDGHIDIVTLDMLPRDHKREMMLSATLSVLSPVFDSSQVPRNVLLLNRGNGLFSDIAGLANIDATDWSWPALFADFDHDGRKDLFIGNGMKRDMTDRDASYRVVPGTKRMDLIRMFPSHPISNFGFWNNGNLSFDDSSSAWGLDQPNFTYGAVYADLDNDGDLDLVLSTADTNAFVYRNNAMEQGRGNYLKVKLEGTGSNRYAQGARLEFFIGSTRQMLEQMPVRGYLGCVDPVLHVGLGKASMVDSVFIRWPGGTVQTIAGIKANQTIRLRQKDAAKVPATAAKQSIKPMFVALDSIKTVGYYHHENIYDDLKRERLLPRRLSQNGPGLAVGDVNNDGLEDLYLGAAESFTGRVLLQQANGRFTVSPDSLAFIADSASEDMGALFFDADNDGDLDLYVVSGGIEFDARSEHLQDRLYLNDGKGRFKRAKANLPEETTSGSCVVAGDYDADGDLDLFVGGRAMPGKYPLSPNSAIFRNDAGKFTDVTAEVCPQLVKSGMICAALWTDFDNDGRVDLITAGEWVAPRLFRNDGGRLAEVASSGLETALGWWNSIAPGDFDNDGDIDYIIGNLGTNWRYRPSKDAPIKIYAMDFDGNGSVDPILTYFDRAYGKEFPVMDRMRLISHIPSTHAKYNTFASYATTTITDMYPKAKLDSSYQLTATEFSSCYAENTGNGKFVVRPLPFEAQMSPVFGIAVEDFDGDGKLDALLSGNFYDGPEPTVVRYDASWGLVIKGDGRGGFTPVSLDSSGVIIRGDTRGTALVRLGKTTSTKLCAMVLNNSGPVMPLVRDVASAGGRLWTLDNKTRATHALIQLKDGTVRRCEFNRGSGYLTQNSPTIVVTPAMLSMRLFDGTRELRQVNF